MPSTIRNAWQQQWFSQFLGVASEIPSYGRHRQDAASFIAYTEQRTPNSAVNGRFPL